MTRKHYYTKQEAADMLVKDYGVTAESTIYSSCESVAPSGMSATYRFYVVKDGQILNVTQHVANLNDVNLTDRQGRMVMRINGAGFDRAADAVMRVSEALFGDSYALRNSQL